MFCYAYGLAVNGAKVAIIGRNKEKLAKMSETLTENAKNEYSKEATVKGYSCNVLDKEELVKTYEQIKAALGSCDILINGAGGNQPGAIASVKMLKKEKQEDDYSFWDLKEENIRNVMDLNYMGTLLPIQVFTRDMVEKRKGSIINIASVSSILPLSKVMAYSNAKSAVQSLTQCWRSTLDRVASAAMPLYRDFMQQSRTMICYLTRMAPTQTEPETSLPELLWDVLVIQRS